MKEVDANKEPATKVVITKETLGTNGLRHKPCGQLVTEVQKLSSASVVDQNTSMQKEMCSVSFRAGNSAPINLQGVQPSIWKFLCIAATEICFAYRTQFVAFLLEGWSSKL